jgi:tetratricopeptide (TPR) repeat protein
MGAAVAAKEPGLAVVGEGVNVSLKIGFTREFEAEADKLGAIWVTRAGYDSAALTHFLDKIIRTTEGFPDSLPPYLATHPFPEDRIHTIDAAAETLDPKRVPDPEFAAELPRVQARLAQLLETERASLTPGIAEPSDPRIEGVLERAEEAVRRGDRDGALLLLARIDALERADPRVPFRIGELLYESGRYDEAAASYLRAIQLDSSRALVFFKLGLAFKDARRPLRAVYAFEQAVLRTAEASELRKRSEWEIFKLTFVPVEASGFVDASDADAIDAAEAAADARASADAELAVDAERMSGAGLLPNAEFTADAEFVTPVSQIAWWARLGSKFRQHANQLVVRWIAPSGEVVKAKRAKKRAANLIISVLDLSRAQATAEGRWTLELVLEDDVIDRRIVVIRAQPGAEVQPL